MTGSENGATRGRVLVVEDEFLLAAELRDVLTGYGFHVVGPVGRVADALALARAPEVLIDAAVLDFRIADGDSELVAEALAARGCPFLLATGYRRDDLPAHWDVPILTKPIEHQELLCELGRLVRR